MLGAVGIGFEAVSPLVEETHLPGEPPSALVVRLAADKARAVAGRVGPNRWVLGVDTVVSIDGRILGKPVGADHAVEMLLQLSARTHTVFSGYAIVGFGEEQTGVVETRVTMRSITREEAATYVATGEPLDKAGAYAIQGDGNRFIASVEGSRVNVAGLPLEALLPVLDGLGITSPPD